MQKPKPSLAKKFSERDPVEEVINLLNWSWYVREDAGFAVAGDHVRGYLLGGPRQVLQQTHQEPTTLTS